ncbi:MAG: IS3 family transposase, partial [Oscillospiraceae bacterium]|nr:IS3 family transposase [Oscillospiraceae bacterium]
RCIDNGPMEGFWGILKSEMYYLRKFSSKEELTKAIEDYIEFYNTGRYHALSITKTGKKTSLGNAE